MEAFHAIIAIIIRMHFRQAGEIITIHRPRGISCNKCHTDDCRKCHTEPGSNARWEKRLDHFKVMAKGH
jgi:hypothetical protein